MAYTGGEVIVEVLRRQGVKAIFCSPGTEWAPVWEALAKLHAQGRKEPAYFNCRHEMLAVSAAIGYAMKGGGVPAVLLHTSSGLLHGSMAIRGAYMHQIPLLVCTGESVRFTEGRGPRGQGHQWLHGLSETGGPTRMAATFVKWGQAVTSRETLAAGIARACEIARLAPAGPAFMSVPLEYMQEQREEELPQIPTPRTAFAPDDADVEKIATLLRESERPVIITERAGHDPGAVPKLVELAEALAIPVFETSPACINFPKDHPLHAGYDVSEAIREADLILVVAAAAPWDPQQTSPAPGARILFIDEQALYEQLPFWNYRADMIVAADPLPVLDKLAAKVRGAGPAAGGRLDYWRARHEAMLSRWDREASQARDKKPIDPRWLCSVINEWLPPDTIVVRELITQRQATTLLIRRIAPGNLFMGNISGLGSGMGVTLGVKLVAPGQPVLHLVGDGSFNYAPVVAALGFSQEYRLPVLTIIFNNGSYRAMESAHLKLYPEGWAARTRTFYGVDIAPNPDYAQLARAFDAYGEKVEDPGEIAPALARACGEMQKGRAALLDVILAPGDPR